MCKAFTDKFLGARKRYVGDLPIGTGENFSMREMLQMRVKRHITSLLAKQQPEKSNNSTTK